jgi:hypothetical protein
LTHRISIGVGCHRPGERAAVLDWLNDAGYDPVPLLELTRVLEEVAARRIEAVVADVEFVGTGEVAGLVRRLGINRPLVLIGDAGTAPSGALRDLSWLDRPVTRDGLLLSVALSLAEGRPARRSPRRAVERLTSSVDGVSAYLLDVSSEGVRVEIAGLRPGALPPYFTLRVPSFGLRAAVRRVWVTSPHAQGLWCGGLVEGVLPGSESTWSTLVAEAPAPQLRVGSYARSR